MSASRAEPLAAMPSPRLALIAREPASPWAARDLADLVPPATLPEARERRDELAALLRRERAAAADFLLALADFDRRRGWERLGHASLFAFLCRELDLSNGAAYLRSAAARLLPRFPSVEAALRDGRLCLSAVGELARVLTAENAAEVLPRYYGRSTREAREVTAALLPRADPPRREVVTRAASAPRPAAGPIEPAPEMTLTAPAPEAAATASLPALPSPPAARALAPLRAHEVAPTHPGRPQAATVEPLTADLRRLHLTVSTRFMEKVARARTGLSHAAPRATAEEVLEAALDLLLEKQARRKALVKRPRKPGTKPGLSPTPAPTPNPPPPCRPHTPAAVEREVRCRDGDRCQWPLDAGGVCGSTWQVELDHIVPLALGGPTEAPNLRCVCRAHNGLAALLALGEGLVASARGRGPA